MADVKIQTIIIPGHEIARHEIKKHKSNNLCDSINCVDLDSALFPYSNKRIKSCSCSCREQGRAQNRIRRPRARESFLGRGRSGAKPQR